MTAGAMREEAGKTREEIGNPVPLPAVGAEPRDKDNGSTVAVIGDYRKDGYAHVRGLIPPEVAAAFLRRLRQDMGPDPVPLSRVSKHPNLLARPAFEVYGQFYPPLDFFLWGLTPAAGRLVGVDLLPTYAYLRLYREGDVCKVHSDRYACQHSLSLTLGYSDGKTWALEVERRRTDPSAKVDPDFGGSDFGAVEMAVGDAVLYQGVHHRHGRTTPNPNRWSAHIFLHWVERDGPYGDQAFDGRGPQGELDFGFG